jgi:hypothetical protein
MPETAIRISDVAWKFLKYFRAHPAWGSLHVVMEDCNWECAGSLEEWAIKRGDKPGARLAEILASMTPKQIRILAQTVDRLDAGEKISPEEMDADEDCQWCGGETDEDGNCMLSYCKGNS